MSRNVAEATSTVSGPTKIVREYTTYALLKWSHVLSLTLRDHADKVLTEQMELGTKHSKLLLHLQRTYLAAPSAVYRQLAQETNNAMRLIKCLTTTAPTRFLLRRSSIGVRCYASAYLMTIGVNRL